MFVRTISADLVPGAGAEATRIFQERVVPEVRKQPGFVRTELLIDEAHNRIQTVSVWQTREAMDATAQGSEYLTNVLAMLRPTMANRQYAYWEVTAHS